MRDPLRSLDPAAAAFARRLFGSRIKPMSVVGSAPASGNSRILKNNPNRIGWLIMNRDVVNAAVDLDPAMTFANGTKIGADGGFASMSVAEDGDAVTYEVFAAGNGAAVSMRVIEFVAADAQEG